MTAPVQRRRARILLIITVTLLLVAVGQLFNIQVVRGAELAEQGRQVRTAASAVQAPRGRIVDASGQTLADSVMTYHIAVNQNNILEYRELDADGNLVGAGPVHAAKQLASLLEKDPAELGGQMLGDSSFVYLAKNIDEKTYREIRRLNIYGIEWEPVYERVYPAGDSVLDIVGFVNMEGVGSAGLEQTMDAELQGTPGEEAYEIGATGEVIPGAKITSVAAEPGATIHSTVLLDLQHSVQKELDAAVTAQGAEWGAVVVRAVGEPDVYAMVDSVLGEEKTSTRAPYALQMVFEPGSAGKILTMATAIEQGAVGPETSFHMDDHLVTPNGQKFVDIHEHPRVERTVTGIFAQSYNTGTVLVGSQVTDEARHETMVRFGLGAPTGIEMGGESSGLLTEPATWDGRTRYTTMFGQGYAVTALQAANIAATVGNGGVRIDPRIVKGTTDSTGVYEDAEAPAPIEALRPDVAQTLLTMMESVVATEHKGTGVGAHIEGYRLAAKTGTSETPGGGTAATTVAVLPAHDPQVAISVILFEPKAGKTASESAVPLLRLVALDTIRSLDIPPTSESPRLYLNSLTG